MIDDPNADGIPVNPNTRQIAEGQTIILAQTQLLERRMASGEIDEIPEIRSMPQEIEPTVHRIRALLDTPSA